jgi:phosphoribosylaminoimidazole-succinocarboxamide synthase
LPKGLKLASKLPQPIFTPAMKAESGHDENISIAQMDALIGPDLTKTLIEKSLKLYRLGHDHMAKRGVILADTKFEFGILDGEVILIDEVMTPDSSRYWPVDGYQEGISPPSYDKQIIRDYLEATWDKEPPAPLLPEEVVHSTAAIYQKLYDILTQEG